jgi:hypothetical protein
MNPLKYAQMIKYLTREKKANPDLPDVFPASKAPIPPVREDVETIDAINRFVKDNPVEKAEGGRIELNAGGDAVRLKALQADYDKFGKSELDKGAKVLGFKNYAAMEGQENNNFRRKIKDQLTEYGEVLPKGFESDSRGRRKRIKKEQGIQIKLLEETNKKKFFDPKAFAKANNISMATLKDQAERLQTNIYKKRTVDSKTALGIETVDKLDFIPNDAKITDNALRKLGKSELIFYDRKKIDELFFDAFGRKEIKGTNKRNLSYEPEKFLAIKKNLNEYRQLRNAINLKYPNVNFELDHPLSKSSLNKLFNATTEELTRVNPLDKDLNRGFKNALSKQYEKAIQGNNLNKKKAVEKIARDLKLNIGKISDDATNFKYGVQEFQKLDIKNEISKSLENLEFLNKNFQDYAKKNPNLFKTAGVSTQQTFTQIKPSELKDIQNIIASFGDGSCAVEFGPKKREGGRIGYQLGTTGFTKCFEQGARNFNDGKFKTTDQVQDAAKILSGGKNVLRAITKYGVVPELAFVAGESLFRTALGETPFNSLLKSIDSFTSIIPPLATDFGSGIDAEKFGKFSDRKLAVDKFRNSQAKVNSLQNKLENLNAITDQGGEGYVGDLTSDINMTQAQLQAAEQELQKNTVSSDIVQFIDRRGQEIDDAERAKSGSAKRSLKDQMDGIPGIRDYTDTESTRIFPKQPSQIDLNLDLLPTMPTEFFQEKTSDLLRRSQDLRDQGYDISTKDLMKYRDELKSMPLSESAAMYNPEQVYGAQGVFSQPLAGGGIAKLAGVSSGVAPVRGPNPQGLLSLKNRVRNL